MIARQQQDSIKDAKPAQPIIMIESFSPAVKIEMATRLIISCQLSFYLNNSLCSSIKDHQENDTGYDGQYSCSKKNNEVTRTNLGGIFQSQKVFIGFLRLFK
jgi:hypothetical protein